jgi:hypothetical protein
MVQTGRQRPRRRHEGGHRGGGARFSGSTVRTRSWMKARQRAGGGRRDGGARRGAAWEIDATSTPAWEQGWRRGGAPPRPPPWPARELRALEELGRRCRAWVVRSAARAGRGGGRPARRIGAETGRRSCRRDRI